MSKTTVIGCLVLAGAVAFLGGAMESRSSLPSSILPGITMFLVMLLTYPGAKGWNGTNRNLTFKKWALGALIASITSAALVAIIRLLLKL